MRLLKPFIRSFVLFNNRRSMSSLSKIPSYIKINDNLSISGAVEDGGLSQLKEAGIKGILYLCPDTGEDLAYGVTGFGSLVRDAEESGTFSLANKELKAVRDCLIVKWQLILVFYSELSTLQLRNR